MNNQSVHICFYSNRCEWSKVFITEISTTPYRKEFRFICVDPSPNRPQLPSWLKQTPTLVISGDPDPKVNSDVMNWLYERKMKDGISDNSGAVVTTSNEPEPYLDSEMGGSFGDSYSFVNSDWSTEGNGGASMPHNFSFLHGNNSVGTKDGSDFRSNTGSNSNNGRSTKEKLLDKQMEAYMKARDAGMPQKVMRQ